MEYRTIVNRTSKTLEGVWDGRRYAITPGKHSFPATMAYKFKYQHPRMGTMDPYTSEMEYLIGIEEDNDPITPVEQTDAIEHLDRSRLRNAIPVVVVQGNGLYSKRDDGPKPNLAADLATPINRE